MTDRPEDIQRRLGGLDQIGQVAGALRAIAASQVGVARNASEAATAYAGAIADALAIATVNARATGSERGPGLLLVVGAAQGFSGSYPARIAEAARNAMRQRPGLLVVGQRTLELLRGEDAPILWSADLPSHLAAVPPLASQIADLLVRLSVDHRGPLRAVVATADDVGPPDLRDLLAVPRGLRPVRSGPPPLTNLAAAALAAGLLEEALFAAVVRALIEGVAAEAQARVEAMARAQSNLRTRRTEAERQLQQARQEQMTTEMIELVVSRL